MQVLIFLGFINVAMAAGGEFNTKVANHARILETSNQAIRVVVAAQDKFKDLISECAGSKVDTQAKLLDCASRFSKLTHQLQVLKAPLEQATTALSSMPPEFAISKAKISNNLSEATELLRLMLEGPQKVAAAFYAMNAKYVRHQILNAGNSTFETHRIKKYCEGFQPDVDRVAALAEISLDMKAKFPVLYRLSIRIKSLQTMASAIEGVCQKKMNVANLGKVSARLKGHLTAEAFAAFKASACNYKPKPDEPSLEECRLLPLTPFSVEWLQKMGGGR